MPEYENYLTALGEEEKEEVQGSTFGDYMDLFNPLAMDIKYEDTRASTADFNRTGVTFQDAEMKELYDSADIATKQAMLKARNDSDALKIYRRRSIDAQALERISQDPLAAQLVMGAVPAFLSPTTALPFGGLFKVAQLAQKARKVKMAAAGAGAAATAGLLDEAAIGAEGRETHYLGVAAASIVLGGGLGFLGAALTSPKAKMAADNTLETGSTVSKEHVNDNYVVIDRDSQTLLVPKVDKTLYDRIPFLGEWFKSPITSMMQSNNSVVRDFSTRIANPTVSVRDKNGDFIVFGKTGADVKQEIIGNFNSKVNLPITELYTKWKEAGNKGTREEFNKKIYRLYVEESNRLQNAAKMFSDESAVDDLATIDAAFKQAGESLQKEITASESTVYYKDNGELLPYTDEIALAEKQAKAEHADTVVRNKVGTKKAIEDITAKGKEDKKAARKSLEEQGLKPGEVRSRMKVVNKDIDARVKADKAAVRADNKIDPFKAKKIASAKEVADSFVKKQEALNTGRIQQREAAREKYVDQYYQVNKPAFNTKDSVLSDGASVYAKYFDDMLEKGQKLEIEELAGSKGGRLYAPRNWDFNKVATLPAAEVKMRLKAAIEADARNEYNNAKDLEADVDSIYALLVDKNAQASLGIGKGYYTKDLPFNKRLASRKLYVDESKVGDLVYTNFEDIAGMYNYFMSGRMGVQHAFGTSDMSIITKALVDEALEKGQTVSAKEQELLVNTVDDLIGVRRLTQYGGTPHWELSRNLMTYNSARLMGGAGGNQLIEMATIAMMHVSKGIIAKNFAQSAKGVAGLLFKGKNVSTDLHHMLINSGYLESALHAHRANRLADNESGFNPKMIERGLNSLADTQMKYNGQRYLTALAEDMSGGAILQYIQRASKSDEAMFSRWGLSMDDVAELKAVLDIDNKNFLKNMTQGQRDKLQLAITKGVAEWVVQPNSVHLPDWFKGAGPVQKLVFQFMKFPMIAQETLMRRGWTEDRAGMIAGIVGAVTMYTTLKYLREEASIALGFTDEIDRKYDIFNDSEQFFRTLQESTNYVANLGMLTTAWNYGNAALQRPELGREWADKNALAALLGPTVGLGQDLSDVASRLVNDGDFTSERQLRSYKQLVPFMSIPGLSEGMKVLAEEYGD